MIIIIKLLLLLLLLLLLGPLLLLLLLLLLGGERIFLRLKAERKGVVWSSSVARVWAVLFVI